jgi:hypothetical protein
VGFSSGPGSRHWCQCVRTLRECQQSFSMALGNGEQSSSSSVLAAPTTTTTTNSTQSDGFFNANNSPPLILAFLAVALFIGAMVAMFGWRRVHFNEVVVRGGRTVVYGIQFNVSDEMCSSCVGEKPMLWDLWTKGAPCQDPFEPNEVGWEGVMVCSNFEKL